MLTDEPLVLVETIKGGGEIGVVRVDERVVECDVEATEVSPIVVTPAEPEEKAVDSEVVVFNTVDGTFEVTREDCVEACPVVGS